MQPFGARNTTRALTARVSAVLSVFLLCTALGFAAGAEPARQAQSEELRALIEAYGRIRNAYVDPVDEKRLVAQAIKGMLSGLDPHSSYLDSEALGNWQADLEGEFGGLGIDMELEDSAIKIVAPIEDTPAARAGLLAGDLITKLDGVEVKGMTMQQAMTRMRGKPNTEIVLTILRASEPNPLIVTLKRAIIQVKSVKAKLLEPGLGYVRVTRFQERTAEQLATALDTLYTQNKDPLRGVVLDLRDNPGGLVSAAVGVATAFLPPNVPVVDLNGRTQEFTRHLSASGEYYLRGAKDDYMKRLPAAVKTVPIVVLVNNGSASASEIVAGALQDYHRAIILGTQTFGKGSVQTTLVLSNNTAIKLTTARYFTPNGRSIQVKGITPDVLADEPQPEGAAAARTREADLEHHLPNPAEGALDAGKLQIVKVDTQTATDAKAAPPATKPAQPAKAEKAPRPQYGSKDDHQLNQALSILRGQQTVSNQ
jgi:carboxyl-terminal processing protease